MTSKSALQSLFGTHGNWYVAEPTVFLARYQVPGVHMLVNRDGPCYQREFSVSRNKKQIIKRKQTNNKSMELLEKKQTGQRNGVKVMGPLS